MIALFNEFVIEFYYWGGTNDAIDCNPFQERQRKMIKKGKKT